MDSQKVDAFLMAHSGDFPENLMPNVREKLLAMDDTKGAMVTMMQFKSPTTALILSIFLGSWGIDRMYIGQVGLGIVKLITCGGCGIWTIIDWFMIMGATREANYNKLAMA